MALTALAECCATHNRTSRLSSLACSPVFSPLCAAQPVGSHTCQWQLRLQGDGALYFWKVKWRRININDLMYGSSRARDRGGRGEDGWMKGWPWLRIEKRGKHIAHRQERQQPDTLGLISSTWAFNTSVLFPICLLPFLWKTDGGKSYFLCMWVLLDQDGCFVIKPHCMQS